MNLHSEHKAALRPVIWALLVLAAIELIVWLMPPIQGSRGIASYAPLHTSLEIVAIVISVLVFAVGWGTHDKERPEKFTLLAVIFLGVALLDFLHALSYTGMPDFITASGPEKAIDFWLAARAFAALGMLLVALLPWQPMRSPALRKLLLSAVLFSVWMTGWIVMLHPEWIPRTFIPGQGLTAFKVICEYFLIVLYLAAAAGLLRQMRFPQPYDVVSLFGAACVMALSEFFFTLYSDVTDLFNLLGHVYKVIAYGFLYKCIFLGSVKMPFQKLHESREALRTSEERWKFALEGAGDGVWDWNMQTGEVIFSRRSREMFGLSEDEAITHVGQWRPRIHPEDLQRVLADEQAYFDGKTANYFNEHRVLCKDGGWKWILERGMVVSRDAVGKPLRMIGTQTDISERKLAEEKLRLLARIFESGSEAFMVCDADNRIVTVNRAFTQQTGFQREEAIGKTPRILSSGLESQQFYAAMWRSIREIGHWQGEIRDRRKNGEVYPKWLTIDVLRDEHGNVTNYIASFSDITEKKRADEKINYLAHHDILTGLPNE